MQERLCIDGLPEWMDTSRLQDICNNYGRVVSAHVVKDVTGRSLAFGFVEMSTVAEMDKVIRGLDGTDRFGSILHVARTKARVVGRAR